MNKEARMTNYIGMISSDWNQCLAPCGPFDVLAYHHPGLQPRLDQIFRRYTANAMTLTEALHNIHSILPAPLSALQMDAYLHNRFETYHGVKQLMAWCRRQRVLFMINTTGMAGYFQRALSSSLLPDFEVLCASPWIRYNQSSTDPARMLELHEITDKPRHTAGVAAQFNIPSDKIIIMGDSGGDGPHFEWAADNGATLIGSMVKYSLETYCAERGIQITHRFGHCYAKDEQIDPQKESACEFTDLIAIIEKVMGLS